MELLKSILPVSLEETILFFGICFICFFIGYFFAALKKHENLNRKIKQLEYENDKLKYVDENKSVLNNSIDPSKLKVVQTRDRDGSSVKE